MAQCSGFRVQGSEYKVQGSGFRVQGSGFRVQGPGFRVQGLRFEVYVYGKTKLIKTCLAMKFTTRILEYSWQRSCCVVNFIARKVSI
jgi:hypothetical protein